jgi:hypothetical protein
MIVLDGMQLLVTYPKLLTTRRHSQVHDSPPPNIFGRRRLLSMRGPDLHAIIPAAYYTSSPGASTLGTTLGAAAALGALAGAALAEHHDHRMHDQGYYGSYW